MFGLSMPSWDDVAPYVDAGVSICSGGTIPPGTTMKYVNAGRDLYDKGKRTYEYLSGASDKKGKRDGTPTPYMKSHAGETSATKVRIAKDAGYEKMLLDLDTPQFGYTDSRISVPIVNADALLVPDSVGANYATGEPKAGRFISRRKSDGKAPGSHMVSPWQLRDMYLEAMWLLQTYRQMGLIPVSGSATDPGSMPKKSNLAIPAIGLGALWFLLGRR